MIEDPSLYRVSTSCGKDLSIDNGISGASGSAQKYEHIVCSEYRLSNQGIRHKEIHIRLKRVGQLGDQSVLKYLLN